MRVVLICALALFSLPIYADDAAALERKLQTVEQSAAQLN